MKYLALIAAAAVFFGQAVADPYRSLEDAQSSGTQRWIDAQNARADKVLDAYPGNAAIAKRVEQLSLTGTQQFEPQIAGNTLFYMREIPPQPQPVLIAQPWPSGAPHVVLDPASLGSATSIDEVWPAPNGRTIAIGTSSGGSESTTIRLIDVSHKRAFGEALGPAGGGTTGPAVAWDANSRGFSYARLPANGSQFGIKLYHHVLGTPQTADVLELGEVSPIAEYDLITSTDAREAAALVHFGDGAFDRVAFRSGRTWKFAAGEQAGVTGGAFVGPSLYVVATGGSPNGRIAQLSPGGALRTIVAQATDWALHDIAPIRGGFLVTKSWGTRWAIDHYSASGRFIRTVALPASGIGIDGIASNDTQRRAVIAYSGWAGPAMRWIAYDGATGSAPVVYDLKPPSRGYTQVRVHELLARSKDGTRVPVTVLALESTPQNGNAPAILTGYGGFDLATQPYFIGPELAWLQMGGILAVANIRGGNEFGESWHRQGMLTNKQNVFDDFYASAQELVRSHWTSTPRLGIEGGSNGGLLVGAALVQHPEEYRAAVGFAGIYDVLRHHLFPNGAYNVTEYGRTDNPTDFQAMYAYSPYHHVKKGVAYPSVLLVTSENDPRVAPWQSWKFAAALQNATSSSRPVIVLTHRTGGHGHGASFAQRVGNTAVGLSFMAAQLGLRAP